MEEGNDTCLIKRVIDSGCFSRSLVNFEHGDLPAEEAEGISCQIYLGDNPSSLTAEVERKRNVFRGTPDSEDLCQTLLLVRSKGKNKVRLISIPSCILKKPIIKKERKSKSSLNTTQEGWQSQMLALSRTFGSKKSKRQSELGLMMKLNTGEEANFMKESISGISIKKEEIKGFEDGLSEILSLLPPCNREAAVVSEVYNLDSIITESERNSLLPTAQTLIDNPPPSTEEGSYFLLAHMKILKDELDAHRMVPLIFADSLVRFLKINIRELKKKTCSTLICPFSESLGMKILKEFTAESQSGRSRPPIMKDKAVCYIMVLILLACDYSVDINVLSVSLKGFGIRKLRQLARTVGVAQTSLIKPHVFTLKLPLPTLPVVSLRQQKKLTKLSGVKL